MYFLIHRKEQAKEYIEAFLCVVERIEDLELTSGSNLGSGTMLCKHPLLKTYSNNG